MEHPIRLRGRELGLKDRAVAKLARMSPQMLCDIIRGRRAPSAALVRRLMQATGLRAGQVLNLEPYEPGPAAALTPSEPPPACAAE